ncbi:hypothetical protein CDCA_CDCA07G2239 [Cyanidium caldarium]|uniref:S1 motif domain-containing protein n=1 Tax=Cyanidium caldarium TaxID=2771 RepID=A0AAV9IVB3_CYACA|nr:hypothetical protein CDCA_CDCA07G2239 [Cyanidium caldarium]
MQTESSSSSASADAGGSTAVAPPSANQPVSKKMRRLMMRFAPERAAESDGLTYAELDRALENVRLRFNPGDKVVGRVVQFEPDGALVDIGAKASAFLPLLEVSMNAVERVQDVLSLGEERQFQVIGYEDSDGQLRLSVRRLEYAIAWTRVQQMQAEDVTAFAEVMSVNRGGAMMRIEGLRAFLPGSHLVVGHSSTEKMRESGRMEDLIGSTLPVKFLEVTPDKSRMVVSHRRALAEQNIGQLEVGALVQGVVRGSKPYGVFVEVAGVAGLLHISQVSHSHVADLNAVFTVGETIKALVISQDKEKGRVSLSTKVLEPEPGDMLRTPQVVYEQAETMAARYKERLEAEERARAEYANDIVSGLGMASLDSLGIPSDPGASAGSLLEELGKSRPAKPPSSNTSALNAEDNGNQGRGDEGKPNGAGGGSSE